MHRRHAEHGVEAEEQPWYHEHKQNDTPLQRPGAQLLCGVAVAQVHEAPELVPLLVHRVRDLLAAIRAHRVLVIALVAVVLVAARSGHSRKEASPALGHLALPLAGAGQFGGGDFIVGGRRKGLLLKELRAEGTHHGTGTGSGGQARGAETGKARELF
jgi:hypothetical protein